MKDESQQQVPPRQKIYFASKTKHAPSWIEVRESGVNVISTWIDEAGIGESPDLKDLAQRCVKESLECDAMIVYHEGDDYLKGAFIEFGIALSANKNIYLVGNVLPHGSAFTHLSNVHTASTVSQALYKISKLPPSSLGRSGSRPDYGNMDEQQYRELGYDERRAWDAKIRGSQYGKEELKDGDTVFSHDYFGARTIIEIRGTENLGRLYFVNNGKHGYYRAELKTLKEWEELNKPQPPQPVKEMTEELKPIGKIKYNFETGEETFTASPQEMPDRSQAGKALEIIEVIQTDLYRDGGSKAYIDAEGFKYIYPVNTAFRKHEPGIYTDWPDKGGNRIDVLLKVVKELNGIKNGWWKEDHYVPYPDPQPPQPGKEEGPKNAKDKLRSLGFAYDTLEKENHILKASIAILKDQLTALKSDTGKEEGSAREAAEELEQDKRIMAEAKLSGDIEMWYKQWCNETKRSGGVLISTSIKELLMSFSQWQASQSPSLPFLKHLGYEQSSPTPKGIQWKKEMRDLIDGYESWEAELISDNRCWGPEGMNSLPTLTQELYNKMIELQGKRNWLKTQLEGSDTVIK